MSDTKSKAEARSLYYAFILYPESAPSNWLQILDSYHVAMAISPLHHPGKSTAEPGEPEGIERKEHHHVMIFYGSTKTKKQAEEIAKSVNGTIPFPIHSKEGYARYLCHLDSPDKEQFDIDQVKQLGGLVYKDNIGVPYNRPTVIREMIKHIRSEGLFSFSYFVDWCATNNDTWFRSLISDCGYIIKEYMQSCYWEMKNQSELSAMQKEAQEKQEQKPLFENVLPFD